MSAVAAGAHPKLTERAQVWQNGLFGCTNDCGDCCFGCLCLPCLWGRNNKEFYLEVEKSTKPCCKYFWCCPCACVFAADMRRDIRTKYNLSESPCNDCFTHCCCGPCAVCQEARELKYMRKVDPERAYVAPGSQEMGPTRGSAVAPAHSPAHAAPGESINDREKITETKVTERIRDMDRQNMSDPASNANVQNIPGATGAGAPVNGASDQGYPAQQY